MSNMRRFMFILPLLLILSACTEIELASHIFKTHGTTDAATSSAGTGNFKIGKPYSIDGRWYYPKEQYELEDTGIASWYGPGFHGKRTANGEVFDKNELTAAHRTLQMPSLVRVTNLDNGRSLIVRVNDRGPYKRGRVMDVSEKAADLLGFKLAGTAKVKLQVLREESLQIAQAARDGASTKGYELAMNQGTVANAPYQAATAQQASLDTWSVESVQREALLTPSEAQPQYQDIVPGHTRGGQFYPDPIITEFPVTPSSIYVQAGSFSVRENAVQLSHVLQGFSRANVYPAQVNGRQFYRVRLGPLSNVQEADEILARLISSGHKDTIIVVE
jgi:rare lipoprotein A